MNKIPVRVLFFTIIRSELTEKLGDKVTKRAIMGFNGDLFTHCGRTYLRAFLLWVTGMAISMK